MGTQEDTPRTVGAVHVSAPPGDAETGAEPEPADQAAGAPAEDPHPLRIVVWDTPPAVERGKPFTVKVGMTCPAGYRHSGRVVEIRDEDGERRATATVGDEPWPDTDALYHTEVALAAPDAEGLHTWEAAALPNDRALDHNGATARFGVRVVGTPECAVTVVASDAESGDPVEGARVVVHPYRTVTDENGVAILQVPAGEYRLFVSGKGYIPFRFDGEVKSDTTIQAGLVQDVELSDADIWS